MEEDKIDLTQASTDDHADLIQGVREKNAKRTLSLSNYVSLQCWINTGNRNWKYIKSVI